ncbi:hypothetical protein FM036_21440 [Nostoc sp. HG1]|nr:hypothetical protein [Nostoc sp. HG1]
MVLINTESGDCSFTEKCSL